MSAHCGCVLTRPGFARIEMISRPVFHTFDCKSWPSSKQNRLALDRSRSRSNFVARKNSTAVRWYVLPFRRRAKASIRGIRPRPADGTGASGTERSSLFFEYYLPLSYVEVRIQHGALVRTEPSAALQLRLHPTPASEAEIDRMTRVLPQYNCLPRVREKVRMPYYPLPFGRGDGRT